MECNAAVMGSIREFNVLPVDSSISILDHSREAIVMKAEGVAILIILVFGIGIIGMLSMVMFDKIPTSTDEQSNTTVQTVVVPMISIFGKGLTALDLGLLIVAIIAGLIVFYGLVYNK